MKLSAFRIKNYRSIIDSGWNNIANDNITGLIGQNESGKTSILEALKSFYDGHIIDDVLRSDLSMPQVSCSFGFDPALLSRALEINLLPEEVYSHLTKQKTLILRRRWLNEQQNKIELGDEELVQMVEKANQKRFQVKEKAVTEAEKITQTELRLQEEINKYQQEINDLRILLGEQKKKLDLRNEKKSDQEDDKSRDKQVHDIEVIEEKIQKKENSIQTRETNLQEVVKLAMYATQIFDAKKELENSETELEVSFLAVSEAELTLEQASNPKKIKIANININKTNDAYVKAASRKEHAAENFDLKCRAFVRILEGESVAEAEHAIEEEINQHEKHYNLDEIAEIMFKYIPVFQFFEDFSSLLPNRIDMDDILNENTSVEGFRAAKNFLLASGIDPSFFEQANNRILKQKIENLNGEITLNFQDYWRQNVGKNNKIKVNFELEHYDYKHPEKKGQPYLEFWIKDKNERLYPKQRSRGVRWFLSFYMELQATARENSDRPRVLLIDEPGVSLHARAQEDVLKVFEDIKDKIQIIYSTHSPHLIDINKVYRLLAVQRANDEDDSSETLIFDAKSLTNASADTLSPIYTLMGTRLNEQQFIQKKNNVIVEDISTFYYLTTFLDLLHNEHEMFILPATSVSNINTLTNLLLGWKLDYIVVLDDDEKGQEVYQSLKESLFFNDIEKANRKLIKTDGFRSIEDLFSTIDFKKFVLLQRMGITELNSEYIENSGLSRSSLASNFMLHVLSENITFEDFDQETQKNVKKLVRQIIELLK
ncbi:MAG TPA: AAA family ATPase [Bacteroidales bacterium]|nr:AAA family ATPase [Bacteroidales bacterium]